MRITTDPGNDEIDRLLLKIALLESKLSESKRLEEFWRTQCNGLIAKISAFCNDTVGE